VKFTQDTWTAIAAVATAALALLAFVAALPVINEASRRSFARRRLTQSLELLKELGDSPAEVALKATLRLVVRDCAPRLARIENYWLERRARRLAFLGWSVAAALFAGLASAITYSIRTPASDRARLVVNIGALVLTAVGLGWQLFDRLGERRREHDDEAAPESTEDAQPDSVPSAPV
jgi:hypothetical protein